MTPHNANAIRVHVQPIIPVRRGDGAPVPRGRMNVLVVINHAPPSAIYPCGKPVACTLFSLS